MAWTKIITPLIVIFCVLIRETVSQVQMSVNPEQVVLGSSSPVSTTFTCTISGSANIGRIFTMQILRKRETDLDFVVVGEAVDSNSVFVTAAPQDIVSRGSMSGGIDINTLSSSTLTLTMSTQDVVCTDKGEYQCGLNYQDANSKPVIAQSNGSLSIYVLPYDVSLSARKNDGIIQGAGPGDGAAIVNVGETVEFTCSAKIGSDNTTRLRWKRTSEFGSGNFIPYQQQEDIDDGTSSSMETDCSYTRTATLRYNVTLSDANPSYNLAFQCYVSVDAPGQGTVETQNPPTFYINAEIISPSTNKPGASQTPESSSTSPSTSTGVDTTSSLRNIQTSTSTTISPANTSVARTSAANFITTTTTTTTTTSTKNQSMDVSMESPKDNKIEEESNVGLSIGLPVAALLLVGIGVIVFVLWKRKRKPLKERKTRSSLQNDVIYQNSTAMIAQTNDA